MPPDEEEEERLRVLRALDILDTQAEACFDHIADWGRRSFRVPICIVTLVDANRQWFKACYGLRVDQTGRNSAFCAHAIMPGAPDIFEVTDALADRRFSNNPLVVGPPFIRYYAGAPLVYEGAKLGTLCVIDVSPRSALNPQERDTLKLLASMVCDQLNSRLQSKKLQVMYQRLLQRTAEVNAVNTELQTLIDTANAPIFAIDAEQRVTAWNRKISELTSISRDEVTGQTMNSLLNPLADASSATPTTTTTTTTPTGVAALEVVFGEALRGNPCACCELDLRSRVHGRPIQLQVSVEPKRNADGDIVGAVCIGEDVAARRRMLEKSMENYNLQKTNEAKDAFLAITSHEMRTPLNGLLGMLQLAASSEEVVPDTVMRQIKQAKNSGTLLLNLINDILDTTRIEVGQVQLKLRPFPVRDLLVGVVELVRPKATEASLEMEVEIDPSLHELRLVGDYARLHQVLLNLLWNALKFTQEGFVRLSASLSSRTAAGVQLLLEVADSGIGIAPEDQPLVFERFAVAKNQQKSGRERHEVGGRKTESVGMGMSICKQLVELMDGRIWLHSQPGRGTNVFLQVTLQEGGGDSPVEPPFKLSPKSEPAAGGASVQKRHLEILLVEDNEYNVDVAKQMLEFLGHSVTVAHNGKEAVDALIGRDRQRRYTPGGLPFDAVLMDCDMPIMNGYDAARHIRLWERCGVAPPSVPRPDGGGDGDGSGGGGGDGGGCEADGSAEPPPPRPAVPIIAVTAYAMHEDKQACFNAGMDDYTTKPLILPTLVDKLAVHAANAASASTATHLPEAERMMLDNPLVRELRRDTSSSSDLPANVAERAKALSTSSSQLARGGSPIPPPQKTAAAAKPAAVATPPVPAPAPPAITATADELVQLLKTDSFWKLSESAAATAPTTRGLDAESSALDVDELMTIFGGNTELVRMALNQFSIASFAKLREPWESGDYRRVGQLAHQWKGTCSYIAARRAQRAGLRLEQSAKALAESGASSVSCPLGQEVGAALVDLQSELRQVAPAVATALQEFQSELRQVAPAVATALQEFDSEASS